MAICHKVVDVICFEQAVPQCWYNAKFFFQSFTIVLQST